MTMTILPRVLGSTWYDMLPKISIGETCTVTDYDSWSAKRKRMWNEHVSRLDDTRLVK